MNNYNFAQKWLTRFILNNKYIINALFQLEKFFIKDYKFKSVFICGLARSGSSVLLRYLYSTNIFATHTYNDMPFIMSPNIWKLFSKKNSQALSIKRLHDDGLNISLDTPEAFEEIFWEHLKNNDQNNIRRNFYLFICAILHKNRKTNYLSKNNSNVKRINQITKFLPDSKILIPIREPLSHSNSLLNQHINFKNKQKKDKYVHIYMDLIGHKDFGYGYKPVIKKYKYKDYDNINHWLEQWLLVYKNLLKYHKNKNIFFVSYEKICNDNDYIKKIIDFIDIDELEVPNHKKFFKMSDKKYSHHADIDKLLLRKASILYNKILN
jgi:hypothetical protein